MLGYVNIEGRGKIDAALCTLADDLARRGLRVAGAVQINGPDRADAPCDMDLVILTGDSTIRISQDLGALSRGCRLDPGALEDAVGQVEASLSAPTPPDILIVNKFGKQESEGRGFRSAISLALGRGIPCLLGVQDSQIANLRGWAGDLAQPVAAAELTNWCLTACEKATPTA